MTWHQLKRNEPIFASASFQFNPIQLVKGYHNGMITRWTAPPWNNVNTASTKDSAYGLRAPVAPNQLVWILSRSPDLKTSAMNTHCVHLIAPLNYQTSSEFRPSKHQRAYNNPNSVTATIIVWLSNTSNNRCHVSVNKHNIIRIWQCNVVCN